MQGFLGPWVQQENYSGSSEEKNLDHPELDHTTFNISWKRI